jgi:hypothetical protein
MTVVTTCRRSSRRFPIPAEATASVEFHFPFENGHHCSMRLRDISASGLSFVLSHELPGIEVGDSLDRVVVRIEDYELRGDLLIMHLTPAAEEGAVCGALFYPRGDRNLRSLQALVDELEADADREPSDEEGFSLEGL